jgi:hypothetical protein
MTMKVSVTLSVLLALATLGQARPVAVWTYKELAAQADLIVIATPISSRDTREKTQIPVLKIPAIGVETKFEVLAVLKGRKDLKTFAFFHLREARPAKVPNGPMLVAFDLKGKRRFLLFLKRDPKGRWISVTGQTDPAIGLKDLGFSP